MGVSVVVVIRVFVKVRPERLTVTFRTEFFRSRRKGEYRRIFMLSPF